MTHMKRSHPFAAPLFLTAITAACTADTHRPVHSELDHSLLDRDAELIPVLQTAECSDTPVTAAFCERIHDAEGWQLLRQRLSPGGDWPDADWCDLATSIVVAVGTGTTKAGPGFAVDVATEEGVDVIVLTQRLRDDDGMPRSPVILLAVPHRAHALSIVLRRTRGDEPFDETTLRVFEPLR